MQGVYVVFGLGALMLVAAVFMYSKSDNNNYDQVLTTIQSTRADCRGVQDAVESLAKVSSTINNSLGRNQDQLKQTVDILTQTTEDLVKLQKEFHIMQVRQHTMEKKIIGQNRTVTMKLDQDSPLEVEVIHRPSPPVKRVTK